MRQKEDLEYAEMLNSIRLATPTEDHIEKLFQRLIIPGCPEATVEQAAEKFVEHLKVDCRVLCLYPKVDLVDKFNQILLKKNNINVIRIEAEDAKRTAYGCRTHRKYQKSKYTSIECYSKKIIEILNC